MGQFRIVPKMKGHKARETVINVNCLPNKRVLFTTIPSAMTLFPSKSTEFHTLLNEGTIQSNTGRTSYNN
ncbi:hypothetical protein FACS1894166_11920 [Bacilli bacterium]|nr:hypothetical protein FACS1894166_11920 [Bacilli bacterium]